MKKLPPAIRIPLAVAKDPDRRAFCQAMAASAATVVLGGCQDTEPGMFVELGVAGPADLSGADLATPVDLAMLPPPDMAVCTIPVVDTARLPAAFAMDTATYFPMAHAFVCRDAGGLFTMTSICTHAGCDVRFFTNRFTCPCHGSRYSFTGTVTNGPAASPLNHYAMELSGTGTVSFIPCTIVAATDRYNL